MKGAALLTRHRHGRGLCVLLAALWLGSAAWGGDGAAVLRWGGDQEGGGPYIYPADDDPGRLTGFEVDLAQELGRELGREPRFVQCTWEQLLPQLHRRDIDVALNGCEFTPERAQQFAASRPYYIYQLGLCARRDAADLRKWEDLAHPNEHGGRRRIGVLAGSGADKFASVRFGSDCEIVRYEGSTEALRLVESGQLDATIQDLPILQFYVIHLGRYPKLQLVDEPTAEGYYVMYARPTDVALVGQIDQALATLFANGRLRTIYERYGVWNDAQQRLPEVWKTWSDRPQPARVNRWRVLERELPFLLRGAGVTILLAFLSMPLAVALGLVVALIRAWDTPVLGGVVGHGSWVTRVLRPPCVAYVEAVRGTPLAFQLIVVYFVLPEWGVRIGEFWAGVLALAVNYSAYEAEIFRLGLQAVPRGQMEAALALGMNRALAVRRIILPQAVRIVIPATANDFIALYKDTAVCSIIAVEELSKQYSMGAKNTGLFLEIAALASVLYLLMSYPLSLAARWLERRFQRG